MSNGLKKVLKIVGIVLAVLILLMICIPILFKDKIKDAVLNVANKELTATVEIKDFGLSLFSNFPKATLSLEGVTVIGQGAFERDTLVAANKASVTLDVSSLFGDNYKINKIILDNATVNAIVLEDGKANWDIVKDSGETEEPDEADDSSSAFNLNLQGIVLKDCRIVYDDRESKMKAVLNDWNGTISGDFGAGETTLQTSSTIDEITFSMGNVPVIYKVKGIAEAKLDADLNSFKFTFQDSKIQLNELAASIDGSFGLVGEDGMEFDLKLNAPNTQFKDILSIVPAMYTDEFKNLKTSGTASLDAYIKGKMEGDVYPAFDVKLKVADAMFQYPSLPQAVNNINIDLLATSKGGSLDNAIIDLNRFTFNLGGNPFSGALKVTTPMSDANLQAHANGTIDLGMIKNVYPLEKGTELNGVVKADLSIAARMSMIEKEQYEQVQAKGTLALNDMKYTSKEALDVVINKAGLEFTPRYVNLSSLDIKLGKNDISADGRLENFIAFALKNQTLKGQLNVRSNYLNLNDFMGGDEPEATTEEAEDSDLGLADVSIPKNINFSLNAAFKQIVFGKVDITNMHGGIMVNNGILSLNNVAANLLEGTCNISGAFSTVVPKKPGVRFSLNLANVSFAQTFKSIDAAKQLAPIFENMEGRYAMAVDFNTTIGATSKETLNTLQASGGLKTSDLKIENVKALDALADALKVPGLKKIEPKDLNINFVVSNGRIETKPFTVNFGQGGAMKLSGSTGLDQTIDYKGDITLPKELSNQVIKNVPLTIKGEFSSPKIGIDTKSLAKDALTNVANKLLGGKDGASSEEVAGNLTEKITEQKIARAKKIRESAATNSVKLVEAAEKQAKALEDKAESKLAKLAAKAAGEKLVSEAKKAGEKLVADAEARASKLEAGLEVEGDDPE